MALVHPHKASARSPKGEIHPAIFLLSGFVFMAVIATGVHMLFSLL